MRRAAALAALLGLLGSSALDAQAFRGAPRPHRSGISFALAAASGCGGYDAATCAYFAAMTVQPNTTRKGLLSTMVTCLEGGTEWGHLDRLAVLAMHDVQASTIDMVHPSGPKLQKGGSSANPTFTTDRGWKGDGTVNSYLTFGEPFQGSGSGNFQANAGTIGIWYNSLTAISGLWGSPATTGNAAGLTSAAYVFTASVNTNGGGTGTTVASTDHDLAITRTSSTTVDIYASGSPKSTGVAQTARGTMVVSNAVFLASPTTSGTGNVQLAMLYYGNLNATEISHLHGCASSYLTAIGAQ